MYQDRLTCGDKDVPKAGQSSSVAYSDVPLDPLPRPAPQTTFRWESDNFVDRAGGSRKRGFPENHAAGYFQRPAGLETLEAYAGFEKPSSSAHGGRGLVDTVRAVVPNLDNFFASSSRSVEEGFGEVFPASDMGTEACRENRKRKYDVEPASDLYISLRAAKFLDLVQNAPNAAIFYSLRSQLTTHTAFYGKWSCAVMRPLQDRFGFSLEHLKWMQGVLIDAKVPLKRPFLQTHVDRDLRIQLKPILLKYLLGHTLMSSSHDVRPPFKLFCYASDFGQNVSADERTAERKSAFEFIRHLDTPESSPEPLSGLDTPMTAHNDEILHVSGPIATVEESGTGQRSQDRPVALNVEPLREETDRGLPEATSKQYGAGAESERVSTGHAGTSASGTDDRPWGAKPSMQVDYQRSFLTELSGSLPVPDGEAQSPQDRQNETNLGPEQNRSSPHSQIQKSNVMGSMSLVDVGLRADGGAVGDTPEIQQPTPGPSYVPPETLPSCSQISLASESDPRVRNALEPSAVAADANNIPPGQHEEWYHSNFGIAGAMLPMPPSCPVPIATVLPAPPYPYPSNVPSAGIEFAGFVPPAPSIPPHFPTGAPGFLSEPAGCISFANGFEQIAPVCDVALDPLHKFLMSICRAELKRKNDVHFHQARHHIMLDGGHSVSVSVFEGNDCLFEASEAKRTFVEAIFLIFIQLLGRAEVSKAITKLIWQLIERILGYAPGTGPRMLRSALQSPVYRPARVWMKERRLSFLFSQQDKELIQYPILALLLAVRTCGGVDDVLLNVLADSMDLKAVTMGGPPRTEFIAIKPALNLPNAPQFGSFQPHFPVSGGPAYDTQVAFHDHFGLPSSASVVGPGSIGSGQNVGIPDLSSNPLQQFWITMPQSDLVSKSGLRFDTKHRLGPDGSHFVFVAVNKGEVRLTESTVVKPSFLESIVHVLIHLLGVKEISELVTRLIWEEIDRGLNVSVFDSVKISAYDKLNAVVTQKERTWLIKRGFAFLVTAGRGGQSLYLASEIYDYPILALLVALRAAKQVDDGVLSVIASSADIGTRMVPYKHRIPPVGDHPAPVPAVSSKGGSGQKSSKLSSAVVSKNSTIPQQEAKPVKTPKKLPETEAVEFSQLKSCDSSCRLFSDPLHQIVMKKRSNPYGPEKDVTFDTKHHLSQKGRHTVGVTVKRQDEEVFSASGTKGSFIEPLLDVFVRLMRHPSLAEAVAEWILDVTADLLESDAPQLADTLHTNLLGTGYQNLKNWLKQLGFKSLLERLSLQFEIKRNPLLALVLALRFKERISNDFMTRVATAAGMTVVSVEMQGKCSSVAERLSGSKAQGTTSDSVSTTLETEAGASGSLETTYARVGPFSAHVPPKADDGTRGEQSTLAPCGDRCAMATCPMHEIVITDSPYFCPTENVYFFIYHDSSVSHGGHLVTIVVQSAGRGEVTRVSASNRNFYEAIFGALAMLTAKEDKCPAEAVTRLVLRLTATRLNCAVSEVFTVLRSKFRAAATKKEVLAWLEKVGDRLYFDAPDLRDAFLRSPFLILLFAVRIKEDVSAGTAIDGESLPSESLANSLT